MSSDIDSLREAAQVYRYGLRNDIYDHPRIPERLRQLVGTAIAALKDVSEFEECSQQAAECSTGNYAPSASPNSDPGSRDAPVSRMRTVGQPTLVFDGTTLVPAGWL